MAEILGKINLTGTIAPTDTLDVYPTHEAKYGHGGYREVADNTERDAIPTDRRSNGMIVFVQSSGIEYRLDSGLTNSDWVIVSSSSGGVNISGNTTDDLTEGSGNLYYTDTRVRAAISGGTGLTYNIGTGAFSITDSGVTAASYGSASEIPVITINAQGQITAASTTTVAGVTSVAYNTGTGSFTINTADGGSFSDNITLAPFTTTDLSEGTNLYWTTARGDSNFSNNLASSTTDDLSEGVTNLYYTDARARASISVSGDLSYNSTTGVISTQGLASSTTDDLAEGSVNLYFTDERVDDRVAALVQAGTNITVVYDDVANTLTVNADNTGGYDLSNNSTSDLSEGTNLYYTDARVDTRLASGSVATIETSGNVTVGGDLIVSGTTTTINTETINLADNVITLNSNATGPATENAGLEVERGDDANVTLTWDETANKWTVGTETFVASTFEGNVVTDVVDLTDGTIDAEAGSTASTSQTEIASFVAATFDMAKLIVKANNGTDTYATELLIVHDGTTASATEYGQVSTSSFEVAYDVDINAGNVRLLATAPSATAVTYKIMKTLL